MELKAIITVKLESQKDLLVILAKSKEEQQLLYNELRLKACIFRETLQCSDLDVEFITAGHWNERNQIVWEKCLIPLS